MKYLFPQNPSQDSRANTRVVLTQETAERSAQGGGLQGRLGLAVSWPTRLQKWFNMSQPHFSVYKIGSEFVTLEQSE